MYTIKFDGEINDFYIVNSIVNTQEWFICNFLLLIDTFSYRELLVNNFNGHLHKELDYFGILFNNKKDAEKAIEYLRSLYILNKIEGKI